MLRGSLALRGTSARYPPYLECLPSGVIEQGRYRARFARSHAELDTALRLRFEVFNRELNEGLDASWHYERDVDGFDSHCHHLLVEDRTSSRTVGTYRLLTQPMAASGIGFYSSGEFDLAGLPAEVIEQSVEIGRACIARDFRNRQVLFLLWRGLARYLVHNGKRYLFGCCSLPSQEPAAGWQLYRQLAEAAFVHPHYVVEPLPALACANGDDPSQLAARERIEVPTLFRTYLRYGVLVCGPPAIDREFKTIDYFVLFDREALAPRSRNIFFP